MAREPSAWKSPLDNPDAANKEIDAVLDDTKKPEPVVIETPPDDLVALPGGLVRKDRVIRTAVVRELNGEDEEALARASQSMNPFHFLDRLLKCGVVSVGDERDTETALKDLLIGDREALILGIRRSTYGEDIEIDKWKCPVCGVQSTLTMQLSDIPITKMSNPADEVRFTVPLRKSGSAEVRLATGEDQLSIFENSDLTQAQRETLLLRRCVVTVNDDKGEHFMQAYPSLAREMSMPNRHKILNELRDRQPGPKYDKVKYKCESCGEDTFVAVGLGDLFLDIGWL